MFVVGKVNSRLLVTFWKVKSYMWIFGCKGALAPLTPALFKGQLYILNSKKLMREANKIWEWKIILNPFVFWNMILFGNRVIAGVISWSEIMLDWGRPLFQFDCSPYKKMTTWRQNIGMMTLEAKECLGLIALRQNQLCWKPDFGLLASRAVRQWISVVLRHPVCGILLGQPSETDTKIKLCLLLWIKSYKTYKKSF